MDVAEAKILEDVRRFVVISVPSAAAAVPPGMTARGRSED
jgi:hypothetical protein